MVDDLESLEFEIVEDHELTGHLVLVDARDVVDTPDLDALAERVTDAIAKFRELARNANTTIAYDSALRYWCAWHQLRLGRPLEFPTHRDVVLQYILDHFGEPERIEAPGRRPKIVLHVSMPAAIDAALVDQRFKAKKGRQKLSTIEHRLSVLAWAHRQRGLESANPLEDVAVRQMLRDCRKLKGKAGATTTKKTAATRDMLQAMLDTCDNSLAGLRDRALLMVGFASGGRRRSELAELEAADLTWHSEDRATFVLSQSKTGDETPKPIVGDPARVLKAWLDRTQISGGPVFRRVHQGKIGEGLSGQAVAHIIQRRAGIAELKGDFSGHSLRRGFITEAVRANVPLGETMALTGHRLPRTVLGYYEAEQAMSSQAAKLLERPVSPKSPIPPELPPTLAPSVTEKLAPVIAPAPNEQVLNRSKPEAPRTPPPRESPPRRANVIPFPTLLKSSTPGSATALTKRSAPKQTSGVRPGSRILQLYIELLDVDPVVWRRVLVPADYTLRELHGVVQVAMGWQAMHLYQFNVGGEQYGADTANAKSPDVSLQKLKIECDDELIYQYDFGDDWNHAILIEDEFPAEHDLHYPYCDSAYQQCPPEDCGGPWAFSRRRKRKTVPPAALTAQVNKRFRVGEHHELMYST